MIGQPSSIKNEMAFLGLKNFKSILKRILYFTAYYSGILHLLIYVQKKLKKKHCTVILFYHRFSSGSLDGDLLPHLDIGEFEKQMRLIKRWYSVISMDELDKRLTSRENFPLPSIVVTIDDGYLNNYKLAFPVLKKLDLHGMVYLATGFIGTKNALWVDDLADILLSTKLKSLCLPELFGDEVFDILTHQSKMGTLTKLYEEIVQLEHNKKILIMRKLSNVLGRNEIRRGNTERKMLNWNEVIEMSNNKISFGAHTVSHPTLSRMELQEAKREIFESKIEIEARIGSKVRHFAIPNGKVEDFNEELKKYCKEIGMSSVVSTEPGTVSLQSDPYFLKRINPPSPMYIFACEIARYMFLKKIE
jgi:peptidoglycan/xylan/chitin deacetylase (PgdA/CDA1 family)